MSRQHFLARFEPHGEGGFVYRSTVYSRGVYVTPEERERLIAGADDRRCIGWLLLLPDLAISTAATMFVCGMPSLQPWGPATFWSTFIGLGVLIAFWVSASPNRIIRGRPHIDDGLPKAEAERRNLRNKSWAGMALTTFAVVSSGAMWAMSNDNPIVMRIIGAAVVLLAIIWTLKDAIDKYRDGADVPRD